MSIVNFNTPVQQTRSPFAGLTSVGQSQNGDKPKAKVWLNIGYDVANASGEVKFINLPIGLPIDTMEVADAKGQNEDWLKQRHAQNDLLKALQAAGASMQPGEERVVQLTVKLRRVNEERAIPAGTNEYSRDFSSLLVAAE